MMIRRSRAALFAATILSLPVPVRVIVTRDLVLEPYGGL